MVCLKGNFKKFPFNNINMNKTLCHGCNEDDKTGTLEITPYSSTLAWKIPWTVEPGGLQSMESQRVRHN